MIITILTAALAASTTTPDTGVEATYDARRDRYCLRLSRANVTLPSGVRLYRRECRSQRAWQRDGVTIERRAHG